MMLGIQAIGIIFFLFMLYLTFLYYKKGVYTKYALVFWTATWIIASLLLIFPKTFTRIAQQLEFARTTDFYLTLAIMFFSVITFLNYVNVKRQEQKVEDLVRTIAIIQVKR